MVSPCVILVMLFSISNRINRLITKINGKIRFIKLEKEIWVSTNFSLYTNKYGQSNLKTMLINNVPIQFLFIKGAE